MPINPDPTCRKPAMSISGIARLAQGGALSPNEIRRLHGAGELGGLKILERGEAFVPLRCDTGSRGAFVRRPFECISCGAVLKLSDAECSYCGRPNPDHDHSMCALIEVTSLDDPAPRYVPGWAPPRPLPPGGRLVAEFGRRSGPLPRKPHRRLFAAVLRALGLR